MKKIFTLSIVALIIFNSSSAQKISFHSNGHINEFTKIDTLFFIEYAGRKPSTKTVNIDTFFSQSLMQFDSSFGFTTKTLTEANIAGNKLTRFKKIFSSHFYVYSDGTLQAPTSVLFFKPKNDRTVVNDFSLFGKVVPHTDLKGYYYLHLKPNIFNDGDKIFTLCDSLYNAGVTETIEPVFVRKIKINTDPLLPNEWNITNTGQNNGTAGADMKIANVWALGYTGTGIKVAVIDLGVDLNHPDLQANLLPGYDATGNNSGGAPRYDVYNTHGTECAGIIAEVQNNIGGVGVAYNAKIIPIRFGYVEPPNINPYGYITTSDTWEINSFSYAVNNGADIISNSWGSQGGSFSAQLNAAISNAVTNGRNGKGAIVLFAAGNENSSLNYPASNSNVIAVGASSECDTRKRSSSNSALVNPGVTPDPLDVSCDGEFWWGSNFGTGLDVVAPGVHITTTTLPNGTDYTYAYVSNFNGTSSATPNAAAVLALILSVDPNLTGLQARNILESSCDKVGGYSYQSNIAGQPNGTWSNDVGYGRVNACSAVNKALASTLSINGDNVICTTSNNYTITNLPTGAAVQWQISPTNIATINSPNAQQTTLTANGNGSATLTATVTLACNVSTTITRNVLIGAPTWYTLTPYYSTTGWSGYLSDINCLKTYTFPGMYSGDISLSDQVATSYTWTFVSKYPSTATVGIGPNSDPKHVTVTVKPQGARVVYRLTTSNVCGSYSHDYRFDADGNFCGVNPERVSRDLLTGLTVKPTELSIKPNPANSFFTVQLPNKYLGGTIKIMSAHGQVIKRESITGSVINVNVQTLPAGVYLTEITSKEGQTEKRKIVVVH